MPTTRGMKSPPPRLPTAAHAGAAGGGARTRAIGLRLSVRPGAHLVERRLARAFRVRAVGKALVVERDPHFIERGLVRAFALRTSSAHPTARARAARPSRCRGG